MFKFKLVAGLAVMAMAYCASASWYWPFGDKEPKKEADKRLSELTEPASRLIDEAADFAADGKVQSAVEKYRAALVELDKVEQANPERAKSPEFATLRNKRAYVNAAIDSLLMSQARENAKSVAVSDTTELEKRLADERAAAKLAAATNAQAKASAPAATNAQMRASAPVADNAPPKARATGKAKKKKAAAPVPAKPPRPTDRRGQILYDIAAKDYSSAEAGIRQWLEEKPNNAPALNLRAAMEAERGNFAAAEAALDQAIASNPRSHFAYYNMAQLLLDRDPESKPVARRYYETGRAVGGPKDEALEKLLK